jgi:hypothetical protein
MTSRGSKKNKKPVRGKGRRCGYGHPRHIQVGSLVRVVQTGYSTYWPARVTTYLRDSHKLRVESYG